MYHVSVDLGYGGDQRFSEHGVAIGTTNSARVQKLAGCHAAFFAFLCRNDLRLTRSKASEKPAEKVVGDAVEIKKSHV